MGIARLLDVRHTSGVASTLNQEHYTNWVRFLRHCATNSLCTIVASNFGDNGGAGTGEDYHDDPNPSLDNAFTYAEFDQGTQLFGILVQWADGVNFGNSPGNPGKIDAGTLDGVAVSIAFREDGTSPWGGTVGDTGVNTKGATVWTAGGSTVHAFPRSNSTGGAHNTNKENMRRVADDTSSNSRGHWVANENGLFHIFSVADGGFYTGMYMGRYTPRTDLAGLTQPYCMVHSSTTGFWVVGAVNIYGSLAGTSGVRGGGIVARVSDGVKLLAVDISTAGQFDTLYQPNNLIAPNDFEGGAISIFQRETINSLAGFLPTELVAVFFNTANHNTNAAATTAYMGHTTTAINKWGISWDGGAVPGTNNTRVGRLSFTI